MTRPLDASRTARILAWVARRAMRRRDELHTAWDERNFAETEARRQAAARAAADVALARSEYDAGALRARLTRVAEVLNDVSADGAHADVVVRHVRLTLDGHVDLLGAMHRRRELDLANGRRALSTEADAHRETRDRLDDATQQLTEVATETTQADPHEPAAILTRRVRLILGAATYPIPTVTAALAATEGASS
ncbi:hypothetical protein [Georgenia wangjunii]|uniref:hypothetical protein n=1 Tax=Georgenia wangjunii TaxID=3117730 RepID=UPI002F269A81